MTKPERDASEHFAARYPGRSSAWTGPPPCRHRQRGDPATGRSVGHARMPRSERLGRPARKSVPSRRRLGRAQNTEGLRRSVTSGRVASEPMGRAGQPRPGGAGAAAMLRILGKSNGLRSRQRSSGRYHRMRLSRPFPGRCLLSGRVWGARSGRAEHCRRSPAWQLSASRLSECSNLCLEQCPRQDSNLRSRLRRPVLYRAPTWQNAPPTAPLGSAWGERKARTLLYLVEPRPSTGVSAGHPLRDAYPGSILPAADLAGARVTGSTKTVTR